jgi:UDP-glucose/GDP-mannose dehydrogenase family, NAD binding domain
MLAKYDPCTVVGLRVTQAGSKRERDWHMTAGCQPARDKMTVACYSPHVFCLKLKIFSCCVSFEVRQCSFFIIHRQRISSSGCCCREFPFVSKATSSMSGEWELKICCMGAGYVGGPTMAVIAKQCPNVSTTFSTAATTSAKRVCQ